MRSFARSQPIAAYLLVVYLVAAALFALPVLSTSGLGVVPIELPGVAPFVLLAAIALAVAAFVVTSFEARPGAVAELRGRVFRFRVNPLWFLLALVLLPLAALATAVVAAGPGPLQIMATRPDVGVGVLVAALVAFALINWWEEAGWTGFVLHRLQPRVGPLVASMVTTWLQAVIHLPLVFVAGGVTEGRVPADQIPFYLAALFILPLPVRAIITWLYNATGQSVPVVGLFHAGLGAATGSGFIPVIAPSVDPVWVYGAFWILGAGLVVATRGRLGYGLKSSAPTHPFVRQTNS